MLRPCRSGLRIGIFRKPLLQLTAFIVCKESRSWSMSLLLMCLEEMLFQVCLQAVANCCVINTLVCVSLYKSAR